MKKALFFVVSVAAALLMAGCSTPVPAVPTAAVPAPEPVAVPASEPVVQPAQPMPPALLTEMQQLSAGITGAGALAALGTAESKNLELALNMAKKNGRIELSKLVNSRIEALAKAFSEETKIPYDSLLLSGFNNTGKILAGQIAGSIAQTLKYETTGDTTTAYALMVLDPQAIADQLAKETDLYARLQPTKAFAALTAEIKTYAGFKAAQK